MEAMMNEPTTKPGPVPAETGHTQAHPAKEPAQLMTPMWTDPDGMTPEVRAYYWEFERQIRLRKTKMQELEQSDPEGKTAAMLQRDDRMQTLKREIELLDLAWGYPPSTIKNWDDLSPTLLDVQKSEQQSPTPPSNAPTGTAGPRPLDMGEWHCRCVLDTIEDLKLDPQALQEKSRGRSADRATVLARYKEGCQARKQTEEGAATSFRHAWQALLDDGRIKYR